MKSIKTRELDYLMIQVLKISNFGSTPSSIYLGFHSQTYNRINDSETFYEKSFN